jgi:hypothetical protein
MSFRQYFAAAATGTLVFGQLATAQATSAQPALTDNQILRGETIALARKAVECVFPKAAAHNAFLASSYKTLNGLLNKLPDASYNERQTISAEAYALRLTLEHKNYKFYFVNAAQAIAMAAQVATHAPYYSKPGNQPQLFATGDKDEVSAALTSDAADGVKIWYGLTGPGKLSCGL